MPKQKQKPVALHSSNLSIQQIDNSGPGTILADFEALLDFVSGGVRSTGKYHLLPMDRLRELDERMARPLRPNLERPQQKSFPHINGLYLLLRATRMGVSAGQGKTSGRLLIDPLMLEQWRGLNPTEQYFNLLEAWMRHATWSMVGLRSSGWGSQVAMNARDLFAAIPQEGRKLQELKERRGGFLYSMERACSLALFELFGLMTKLQSARCPWRRSSRCCFNTILVLHGVSKLSWKKSCRPKLNEQFRKLSNQKEKHRPNMDLTTNGKTAVAERASAFR